MTSRMESTGKWVNPCGYRDDNGAVYDMNSDMQQVSDSELLTHIVEQANIASSNAVDFKEKFARKVFRMAPEELHNSRREIHYDWLPSYQEVPKNLGERVSREHLDSVELDQALLDTYEYLQKVAVGLEQTVWDEQDTQGEFLSHFTDAEDSLRNLLCELQMAIHERGLKMRPDVSRDIMSHEFRTTGDQTNMNLRHWLIYRDYMNVLEYVREVFQYLKETRN